MRTARTLSKAISQMLVESVPLLSFQFALLVCLECPNLSFSLRSLCDLCASAVDMPNKAITAEPQSSRAATKLVRVVDLAIAFDMPVTVWFQAKGSLKRKPAAPPDVRPRLPFALLSAHSVNRANDLHSVAVECL